MKTYKMEVTETVQRVAIVDVEAEDLENAKDAAVIKAVVSEEIKGDVFSKEVMNREAREVKQ